jgi:hypothetical protein
MSDDSHDMPLGDEEVLVHKQLRRLQEHQQSDIPGQIAEKAMRSFTLHEEPPPEVASDQVLVVVYPQDPFVGEPEVRAMRASDIQAGLRNDRIQVQDSSGAVLAGPDPDGNYMFWPDSPQFDQVNAFYYATFTLRMYERYARRSLPWAFNAARITVDAHVGDRANAFYNEHEKLLGFHTFELDSETVSTVQSADIVSHETAHAVLDGIRDLYNESFGIGPTAFHESFGDITAMLAAIHDDSLVRRVLEWTKGDMRVANFVATVAEQLTGVLMRDTARRMRGHTVYLRNAINNLKRLPFDELLYSPEEPEFKLGRQSHNYSRLFTGAFYDIFAGIYERFRGELADLIAVYRAREIAGYMLMCAVELGPVGEFNFPDMARALVTAGEVLYDGAYRDVMREVFDRRGLLTPAELDDHVARRAALPDIRLDDTVNSALSASLFLERDVLPALNIAPEETLRPLTTYRNTAGYAFMTFVSSRRTYLEGEAYRNFHGSSIDVFGGLTLMFDADNRLCSAVYRPVLDEDLRQIRILTADLIREGLIVESLTPGMMALRNHAPQGLYVVELEDANHEKPNGQVLVKHPIIVDSLPKQIPPFADYLRRLGWRAMHRWHDEV